MNVVLFGVDENKDFNVWRAKVDDTLHSIAGRAVDTADMFRIGRYNSNKKRLILIKLRSVWDCRVLLNGSRKPKGSGFFLARDEPLDVMRKATLERLKRRAEIDGKVVSVVNGQLLIDGNIVFSLGRGFINGSQTASNV
jgi:hypothetical protein